MKTIDIFHDTICPWCRIGIQSMRMAVQELGEPVDFRVHAFFLDPTVPFEGVPFQQTMQAKMGGAGQMEAAFEQITQTGAALGLTFYFSKIAKLPNTLMSHQLIRLAPTHLRLDVLEAIDHAYFAEGKDIGDREVLLAIAENAGLDREYIADFVGPDVRLKEIDADIRQAFEIGVTQAPFFIVNNKYAIRGAQPPGVFAQALKSV